ncbi:hypothetical protein CDEST_11388 [Colletotrichum destructivum]|uniref:Uncharacterized protein n=1 Tax=Colletotrichum destructivum TaxID=34406 RepID=A0AAX4IT28_9PEZI|nr:hypothetical protein CDEST_11388 [Colletotrichum destructivum]
MTDDDKPPLLPPFYASCSQRGATTCAAVPKYPLLWSGWSIYPSATISLLLWFLFFIWFYQVPSSNQQIPSVYPLLACLAALLALGVLYACQASTTGVESLSFNRYSYPQYLPVVRAPILRWPP